MLSITSSLTKSAKAPVFILISIVVVAGLSQGLLLPVLSIFMEERGISSSVNGLHATALYIGSFAMSLVAERLLDRMGFKKLLIVGLVMVTVALPLFPLFTNLSLWFILRLIVGIGDSAINFAAQLWLLLVTPPAQRGKIISLYGMFYGLGFSAGPLGIKLLHFGHMAPFALLAIFILIMLLIVCFKLRAAFPEKQQPGAEQGHRKYMAIYRMAWFALIPALLYGYLEAGMNGSFPIYGLRIGLSPSEISTLLPFFGVGGLILQLPLGLLSDRIGRKKVLMAAGMLGGILFLIVPLCGTHMGALLAVFMVAGGLVGSFFSLGLAYAADILPKGLLPAANVIASFHFSIGSIVGPNLSGAAMELGAASSLFIFMGASYALFAASGFLSRRKSASQE
ncbi:MFS transporter [Paenibacillus sp. CAA11]|uniref:MFS transporter n=1 Tax=Paenibacillus sp. CAA11 TaxID=1532905 RepID=UPI000D3DC27A|nr:MFS transporter [Paenibacillus sp. CAA11]AWB44835.1 MFS transporter [Paenibacillus sp. CAA11]